MGIKEAIIGMQDTISTLFVIKEATSDMQKAYTNTFTFGQKEVLFRRSPIDMYEQGTSTNKSDYIFSAL